MKLSTYRQRLRDAFYRRLELNSVWTTDAIKQLFEEAGDEVILDALEEIQRDENRKG